jgi:hypothetical protein
MDDDKTAFVTYGGFWIPVAKELLLLSEVFREMFIFVIVWVTVPLLFEGYGLGTCRPRVMGTSCDCSCVILGTVFVRKALPMFERYKLLVLLFECVAGNGAGNMGVRITFILGYLTLDRF